MPRPFLIFSQSDHLILIVYILNCKQCSSRSVGFFRSQLIWIYTVCKGRVYQGSAAEGLTFTTLLGNSADDKLIFSYFSQKTRFDLSCRLSPLSKRVYEKNKKLEKICMRCEKLFPTTNKKNISVCRLLNIFLTVLENGCLYSFPNG